MPEPASPPTAVEPTTATAAPSPKVVDPPPGVVTSPVSVERFTSVVFEVSFIPPHLNRLKIDRLFIFLSLSTTSLLPSQPY